MSQTSQTLKADLESQFGPLMGGGDLWRALGFRTAAAFGRALRMGSLGLRIFEIPNRRGKFALTREVADWLERAALTGGTVSEKDAPVDSPDHMAGQSAVARQPQ